MSRTIILSQCIRQRQCAGRYIAYHMAYDDEIVLFLDGDDKFYTNNVMNIINDMYNSKQIVSTYGSHYYQIENMIEEQLRCCQEFPNDIIENKAYRYYKFISGHLRTGYTKLFKSIKLEHLLDCMIINFFTFLLIMPK